MSSTLLYPKTRSIVIPAGSDTSGSMDLMGLAILEMWIPANITSTKIFPEVSRNFGKGIYGAFTEVRNTSDIAIFIQVTPDKVYKIVPIDFVGSGRIRFKTDQIEPNAVELGITVQAVTS